MPKSTIQKHPKKRRAKTKSNKKTAVKRFKASNPKGNKKPKIKYQKAGGHHLNTKKSKRQKRRSKNRAIVDSTNVKNIIRKVNYIN
jgi:ribosomal protein L35